MTSNMRFYINQVILDNDGQGVTITTSLGIDVVQKSGSPIENTWIYSGAAVGKLKAMVFLFPNKVDRDFLLSLSKAERGSFLWKKARSTHQTNVFSVPEEARKQLKVYKNEIQTSQGEIVYNIPTPEQTFKLSSGTPNHVSLAVVTYLDTLPGSMPAIKEVKIQEVILAGTAVNNSLIKDLRIVNTLTNSRSNFTDGRATNPGAQNQTQLRTRDTLPELTSTPSFFSDLLLSRDNQGNSRFFFSIDYKSMTKSASAFPGLFENSGLSNELVKRAKILTFKVLRKRIQEETGFNKFGFKSSTSFTSQEADTVICQSADQNGRLKTNVFVDYPARGVERAVGVIKEVDLTSKQSNIRSFTGIDLEMKDLTDGKYQYGVEMEILDPTVIYLSERLTELSKAIGIMQDYYEKGNGINPLTRKNNFNPYNKKFLPAFEEQVKTMIPAVENAVLSYLETTELISPKGQNINQGTVTGIANLINPSTGTLDAISTLLNSMLSLSKDLEVQLDATISGPVLKPTLNGSAGPSRNKAFAAIRTERITKQFSDISEIFNSDIAKAAGYNFIKEDADSPDGLLELEFTSFLTRADEELRKYFKTTKVYTLSDKTIDVNTTRLSFLSPLEISFNPNRKQKIENNGERFYNTTPYNSIVTDLLRFNSNQDTEKEPFNTSPTSELNANTQFLRGRLLDFFAGKGCTVTNIQAFQDPEKLDETLDSIIDKNDDLVDTVTTSEKIKLSQNAAYEKSIVNPNEVLFRLIENAVTPQGFDGMKTELYDLRSDQNIFDQLDQSVIDSFPLHVKALITGFTVDKETADETMNVDLSRYKKEDCKCNFGFFYENFWNLMRVETLVGYETTPAGEIKIKSPVFEPVSDQNVSAQQTDSVALCRMRRYTDVSANIPVIDSLSFPIYNESFFLTFRQG